MNDPMPPMVIDAPELSDETAAQILDLLNELTDAFSDRYFHQLRRYDRSQEAPPTHDWTAEDFDDDLPDF